MLSTDAYVVWQVTPEQPESDMSYPDLSESLRNDESSKPNNFPQKVEKLMNLLRKHQHDEEELKVQIKDLLEGVHGAQKHDVQSPLRQTCQCKHRSVKDVLNMLNLSSNQNELLEKIVLMMQGRPGKHKSDKRKTNEVREEARNGLNIFGTLTEKITIRVPLKENAANRECGEDMELDESQLANIAYEVVKVINRTPRLYHQLSKKDFGKFTLPGGDTPPSEPPSRTT